MFCKVRRSFARISLALCCSREREKKRLFGDFFRASAIPCFRRRKKDPARELWYFARYASRCFSSIDVATLPVLSFDLRSLFLHLTTRIRSTISSPCSARPTFPPPITFSPFSQPLPPEHSFPSRVPRPASRVPYSHPLPPALPYSFNPVNQNSTRKRGQMYTMRSTQRTGCPERSPAAIDFRRLDGISAKICFPRMLSASFPDCLLV